MKTVQAGDALSDWHKLAGDTRREPVKVVGEPEGTMIVMSEAEFMKIKGQSWDRLLASMDRLAAEAHASGLTQQKLDELLADET